MSVVVELEDLPDVIAARGAGAFLVSQGDVRARVVSVTVACVEGALVVGAGRQTGANVAERPEVTLLWPAGASDPEHSLLVDGTATVDAEGQMISVVPSNAVLHRNRVSRHSP